MTITALIAALEKLREEHGDLRCEIVDGLNGQQGVEPVLHENETWRPREMIFVKSGEKVIRL